jgi:curved DNA-binding protein CbpA
VTPAATRDPYAVLGVDRSASAAEIRAAYLALVARYHPDRHQGNPLEDLASQRMAEVNQAYEQLSDPARRAAFDLGTPDPGPATARGAYGRPPGLPMSRIVTWALVILALPLLIRGAAGLLRLLARLGSGLAGELGAFRGTPAALAAVLLLLTVLGLTLLRRRRRRP